MTRVLLTIGVVLSVCSAAGAIGYDDFPANLKTILDQRIASLNANGGMCIAGRVTFSDGAAITGGKDVQVNYSGGIVDGLLVYAGGWCIMSRTHSASYAGSGKHMILRSFKYDAGDLTITVLSGQMTYFEFQMNKTPPDQLASVTGTVFDEKGRPFGGALVSLEFPGPYAGDTPELTFTTSSNGQFSFVGLSVAKYDLLAIASEYAYHFDTFTPPPGGTSIQDRRLFPERRVGIQYVYQADGSKSFTGGNLQAGFIDWLVGEGSLDFSEGHLEGYEPDDLRDLELRQKQDVMEFYVTYVNGHNGLYDAGAVPFASITQANSTGYSSSARPCVVGHVYVVRTYEEDYYAKFIVTSNERWFETILPGDPDPIDFASYGLRVDLSAVSGNGKLYVLNNPVSPPGVHGAVLPRYLALSGMTGVSFHAGLQFQYQDTEVSALGLSEDTLSVAVSTNSGVTWQLLPTTRDPANNLLTAADRTSLGWFAIADGGDQDNDGVIDFFDYCLNTPAGRRVDATGCPLPPPDYDGDSDVDQEDFAHLQLCLSGPGGPMLPGCADADLNLDNHVDQNDCEIFRNCLRGAKQEPGC